MEEVLTDNRIRQERLVDTGDTPSPDGRAKSLGEDDVERIVLTS